jgi:hypothetical protein
MRPFVLTLAAVAATVGIAVAIVACSDEPACKPGVLTLHLGLLGDSTRADTIEVDGADPGAAVSVRVPHAVDAPSVAVGIEHIDVDVTFPGGYPQHALVHLLIRALLDGNVIGINNATIQLGDKCGEGSLLVGDMTGVDLDAGAF